MNFDLGMSSEARYDFFVSSISLFSVIAGFYYKFINPVKDSTGTTIISFLLIVGMIFFVYGISLMYENYSTTQQLFILDSLLKRKECINKLVKESLVSIEQAETAKNTLRKELTAILDKKERKRK